jgi:hypothetical protein
MMNALNYWLVAILALRLMMLNVVPAFAAAGVIRGVRLLQPVPLASERRPLIRERDLEPRHTGGEPYSASRRVREGRSP